MKKRLISLILMALMALSCALAEETGNVPLMAYYECFAVPLGTGAIFEIPNEWGYQTCEDTDVPPTTSLLTDQNQMVMAMKLPADWEATDASDALGIQSFIVEGTALMLGLTTPPVGMCVCTGAQIGKISAFKAFKATIPFLATSLIVLMLVSFIPQLTLWIPSILN